MTHPGPTQPKDSIHVLHVDDEPYLLRITSEMVRSVDPELQIDSVTSPREALEKLEKEEYDCIISDFKMPEMDGIQFAMRLREESNVPFILYTGQGSEEVAEAAFAAGIDDYIRKEMEPSHYQILARRIRTAVEKYKVADELRTRENRLWVLHSHATRMSSALTLLEISELTYDAITEVVGINRGGFGIVKGGKLSYDYLWNMDLSPPVYLPLDGRGISVRAVHMGETQLVNDISKDPDFVTVLPGRKIDTKSELAVPVKLGDEVFAVINLESLELNVFTENDQALVETLAQHVASAMGRIEKLSEQRIYEKRLELLHAHVFELAGSSTIEEISDKTQETIVRLFDPQRTVFALVDDGVLKPVTVYGPNTPVGMPLDGPGIAIRAIRTGLSQRVNDTRLDEDYVSGVQPGDPESLSEMDVPLIIDGKVCGLIGIESTRLDAFTLQDQTLVEILAQHVSSAISRLRQLSELEQLVKERTKNLSLSEEKLTNFMESATDAFNLYDSELNLVANNQAAMSLFPPGIIREDVLGKNMLELVPGLEETGRYDEYKRVIETGISIQIDELFLHPSLGDIHLSVKAFKVGDGLGIIGTNITERKQMEENLRNAERLAAAGRIASMVGHDLRGPLQTIKNALYLMERTPKDGAKLRKTMDEAVDYAANMLEELRLNVGDSPLQLQEVNLGALIERAVLEASITDSVETGLYIADGLDSVHVDPLQIRRVLDNLVRNAVEAMPDGGTLKVSAEVNAEGMELTVRDTGTGIPIDLMPDLFKAFVTTKSKGMGLGLAYCKRAVEAHGGTIVVESKEGVGTTFTVKLPRGPT